MANHALLIGINHYEEAPLYGCVNDVVDMAALLTGQLGFGVEEVTMLLDGRATRAAILASLRTMVRAMKPGDRALLHFSGHGVQLPSSMGSGEEDALDEAICPFDYSWDDLDGSFLRDKDFRRELEQLPADATFVWISDSCHSGTLTRALAKPVRAMRPRFLQPPIDVTWRNATLRSRAARKTRGLRGVAADLQLALLAGCKAEQTSADVFFDGRANGALTYFLLRELAKGDGLRVTLEPLTGRVQKSLENDGFEQQPVLEGAALHLQRTFLAGSNGGSAPAAPSTAVAPSAVVLPPWYELFAELDRRAAADASFRRELLAGSAAASREPSIALDVDLAAQPIQPSRSQARGGTVARAFWWGFHIEISHGDLQSFLGVANPINAIVAAIGPVTGPAAPFVALVAGFIAGALGLLAGLDRGRGVYISMSWFAPGVFVPTSV